MGIHIAVFENILLKVKVVDLSFRWKQLKECVANDKIWAFERKLEYWKNCTCHCELDSFPILKYFYDKNSSDIDHLKILVSETCQHLKALHIWWANIFKLLTRDDPKLCMS